MPSPVRAHGAKLLRNGVEVAKLTNIPAPALDSDELAATTHQSPGGFREFFQGLKDGGLLTVEGFLDVSDAAGQMALYADWQSGEIQDFQIVLNVATGAAFSFQAFVKSITPGGNPVEGLIPFSAGLRVTGAPSLDLTYSANLTDLAVEEETGPAIVELVPEFAGGTYRYTCVVDPGSTWVKLTVTGAGTLTVNGVAVSTAVKTGALAIGAQNSVTAFAIVAKQANKVERRYELFVARPAGGA